MRLGFLGRRSLFEVVRRVSFNIALFERGDITIVDAKLREGGDIVLHCDSYRCVAQELFTLLPKLLGGGKVGVDLGTSRNGMAYVWRGEPILHAVLDWKTVEEILRNIGPLQIYIGSSPYVDVKKAATLVGCREVRLVDELAAGWTRRWLKAKYPELEEDEIDALAFTYHDGVAVSLC
ncbi:hypothetical protein [Pyrobaculum islandicum]|uniref:hypothetical protein n=1 Tax=Pyrobaculum islandicum TaxID=2277 RepID=UPI00069FB804|nr:hypothetical protein [Pyrobaculum islandicum]